MSRMRYLIAATVLALAGCTVHLITIQLPQEGSADRQRDAGATSRPVGSFMDRLIEDLNP